MSIEFAFLIYLTLFRLAIIAAGVISIVLGYCLLCRGIWPDGGTRQETVVEAKVAGSSFTLKNAAPGTSFALFGVLIISVMFAKGSPEFTLEILHNAGIVSGTGESGTGMTRLVMRGNEDNTVYALTQQGMMYERNDEREKAFAAYQDALALMAAPMNHLAWLYQKQGKLAKGLPLIRLAVQLRPDDTNFLDTLAVILCKNGEHSEALRVMERAAELNPQAFRTKLEAFKAGSCQ